MEYYLYYSGPGKWWLSFFSVLLFSSLVTPTTNWKEYGVLERGQDFEDIGSVTEKCTGKVEYNFP